MGLDEALAAGEKATADNRAAVDAACSRYAELATERGLVSTKWNGRHGWMLFRSGVVQIFVFSDGTWASFKLIGKFLQMGNLGHSVVPDAATLEAVMVQELRGKGA